MRKGDYVMKLTTTQSKNVQILRGLAAIAVVFIHVTGPGMQQVLYRPLLNFSVGLFLFLSGMLSNVERWKPKKRILKVVIPYFLWTVIYTVMFNIKAPATIPVVLLKNLVTGDAVAIMYYIFVYCELTLLIPLIHKLAKSRYKYWGLLISPIEMIVMRTVPIVLGIELPVWVRIIMRLSCLGWFTYFYLGYLLGNQLVNIRINAKTLAALWVLSIPLQIAEGYYYYKIGNVDCGTQLKLSSLLTSVLFVLLAYQYVLHGKDRKLKLLQLVGDHSFGVYFSHLAVIAVLCQIPGYVLYVPYPITAVISVVLTMICVLIGKKILGKHSSYLAL